MQRLHLNSGHSTEQCVSLWH